MSGQWTAVVRCSHHHPIPALPFREVHRDVGVFEMSVDVCLDVWCGDADAHADGHRRRGVGRDADANALGQRAGGAQVVVEDHGELLAAGTRCDKVADACQPVARLHDPPGYAHEHEVADLVAVGVVDRLESVDVDDDHRERAGRVIEPADISRQASPVGQPGQRVGPCVHGVGAEDPEEVVHGGQEHCHQGKGGDTFRQSHQQHRTPSVRRHNSDQNHDCRRSEDRVQ